MAVLIKARASDDPGRFSLDAELLEEFAAHKGLTRAQLDSFLAYIHGGHAYTRKPVDVRTFCLSPDYMNAVDEKNQPLIWPKVMDCMAELNHGGYDECVLTGSIGSAKSTLALYTQAYQLYLLSCYDHPHSLFNLDPSSEILIVFQSLTESLAQSVDYARLKSMVDRSPYFRTYFRYDKSLKSEMHFPNRIIVKPVASTVAGPIGQNVIGGLIDEINFMQIIEKSKRTRRAGKESTYDQAKMLYESIDRRRRSRFMFQGKLPGILCMASSKLYPGEFTDRKIEESIREKERLGKTTIYVYDKRSWDVKPEDTFSKERFRIFVGDAARKPRILKPSEKLPKADDKLIDYIPIEFYTKFEEDPYGALRDIAGRSTLARHPFMMNVEAVARCFGRVQSVLNVDECDFDAIELTFFPKLFRHPKEMRWVHVDLGLTSDAAGVACGYVKKFVAIQRGDQKEILPEIHFDFILRCIPPKGDEIKFFKIRELLYKLRDAGLNICFVSFDSWQSADSMQLLRQRGFTTGEISMDENELPYDFAKTAFYDGRVWAPQHDHARTELLALERDPQKGKIDHPVLGSKDCADAVGGVIYGLTTRREVWVNHNVDIIAHYEAATARARQVKTKDGVTTKE